MLKVGMEPPLLLSCSTCTEGFVKPAREVRRQRKTGRDHFYCSRRCSAKGVGEANFGDKTNRDTSYLDPGNRRDEFSPFRYYMKKARNRKHETDLDLPYLAALWESQGSKCALSGVQMTLPSTTRTFAERTHDPLKPSLDRIDNAKGYLKGNVRFVTTIANYAKQIYTDEQLIEFCRAVAAMNP